ncbi:hypothetical protein HanIR_Chr15g0728841 [Helianthus annuus]|nr:hypothetical protein HanIR_Chr15g0728841 [Helianthus annuus]
MVPEPSTSPEQDRRGRRGRTASPRGRPTSLVRLKRLKSDGDDGTERDGGAAAWEDGGDMASPREDGDGDDAIPYGLRGGGYHRHFNQNWKVETTNLRRATQVEGEIQV